MKMIFFAIIWLIGKILLLLYRVDVKGLEHLPKSGALLCPNHASNIDPVLIGLCLPLDYHLHFMAKAELFEKPALAWLIRTLGAFPVQRDGRDIQSVKTAMQVLHKGENLLIFPEGTPIRNGVGYHDGLPAHACRSFATGRRSSFTKRASSLVSRTRPKSRAGAAHRRNCRPSPMKCCAGRMPSADSRWGALRCESHLG